MTEEKDQLGNLEYHIEIPSKEEMIALLQERKPVFEALAAQAADEIIALEPIREILRQTIEKEVRHVTALVFTVHGRDIVTDMIRALVNRIDQTKIDAAARGGLEKAIQMKVNDYSRTIPNRDQINDRITNVMISNIDDKLPDLVDEAMKGHDFLAEFKSNFAKLCNAYLRGSMSEIVRQELGLLYQDIQFLKQENQILKNEVNTLMTDVANIRT